jgi:hypothetical protein
MLSKLKSFFATKKGRVLYAILLTASGAAAQELNFPFLSTAMKAALLYIGAAG